MADPVHRPALTLDGLAHALRGMPRDAPILVRMPDGTLRGVRLVRPVYVGVDGVEFPSTGSEGQGQRYAITLVVEEAEEVPVRSR